MNNAANIRFTKNADGFNLAGGTTVRSLGLTGGDVDIVGSGSAVITFPTVTSTLATLALAETLTNKTLSSPVLNTPTIGTSILPTANDGAALGASGTAFSDLFLASGSVINFNAGDVLITHASNTLTLTGGTLVTQDHSLQSGSAVRTSTTAAATFHLAAYDVDGAAYVNFITFTANNTPTCNLAAAVTYNSLTIATLTGSETFTNKTLTSPTLTTPRFADGGHIDDNNGNEQIVFHTTASAVNQVGITNSATGNAVALAAEGGDTDISLSLAGKGVGRVQFLSGRRLKYNAITSTTTLDGSYDIVDATSGTFTITLPTAASVGGAVFIIKNSGTGIVTVDGASSETIDGQLTKELLQYDSIMIASNGTNWIVVA